MFNSAVNNDGFMILAAIILMQATFSFQNLYHSTRNNERAYKSSSSLIRLVKLDEVLSSLIKFLKLDKVVKLDKAYQA